VDQSRLVGPLRVAYQRLASPMRALGNEVIDAQLLRQAAPALLGRDHPARFLVLLADNAELRPGGGFYGTYAVVSFDHGRYIKPKPRDVYLLEDPLANSRAFFPGGPAYIPAAPALLGYYSISGGRGLYMRDASWSPNWESDAVQAEKLYQAESGEHVDGVIQVDVTTISYLLQVTGPLSVPGYNGATVDAGNVAPVTIAETRGSATHKAFLGPLQETLLEHLNSLSSNRWADVVAGLQRALAERHLMLHFDDPDAETLVGAHGFNGKLPACGQDCLMIVYGNLGGSKSDYWMKRDVQVRIDAATGAHHVDLDLDNVAPGKPGTPYTDYYVNVRFYLPPKARVTGGTRVTGDGIGMIDLGMDLGYRVVGYQVRILLKKSLRLQLDYLTAPLGSSFSFTMPRQPGLGLENITLTLTGGSTIVWKTDHRNDWSVAAAARGG
jgi:hypothetical protein